MQTPRVIPWEQPEPPTEPAIRKMLDGEGLSYSGWGNGPHDTYVAHVHAYHKVIYVLRGSITFGLPELGERLELAPGDRLELPAGTWHDARVGPQGVTCLEAHKV